jgi:hypothetical protein
MKIQSKIEAAILATLLISIISAATIGQARCQTPSNSESSRVILVKVNGLQAKIALPEITFISNLQQNSASYTDSTTMQGVNSWQQFNIQSRVAVPSNTDTFDFAILLKSDNTTLMSASGSMSTTGQGATYNALYINSALITTTDNASLTFDSVGILGSMDVRFTQGTSETLEFKADLTWNTAKMSLTSTTPSFVFANVTSNIPEVPFTINIYQGEHQVLYASGELQVSAENIAMPIPINSWDNNYIQAWNVTFDCANFAVQSKLPLSFSANSSKIASESNVYRGQFEKVTNPTPTPTPVEAASGEDFMDSIAKTVSTPMFIALLVALAIIVGLVILFKVKR